ncbi:unnamed protein product [Effrenium voratum]|nr:unnamed protein product [Effrenium voratum]CAJ1450534.1 unnamed protein product [Effrenium voratum]
MQMLSFVPFMVMAALGQETVETPVPTPPPEPIPAPRVLSSTPELTGDELIAAHRQQYLSTLASAGITGRKGAWLYGDYLNDVEGVHTAVGCAQACQADAKCYHWNFQVERARCDLKAENGGINEDISDWISGDVPRASKKPADEI